MEHPTKGTDEGQNTSKVWKLEQPEGALQKAFGGL